MTEKPFKVVGKTFDINMGGECNVYECVTCQYRTRFVYAECPACRAVILKHHLDEWDEDLL